MDVDSSHIGVFQFLNESRYVMQFIVILIFAAAAFIFSFVQTAVFKYKDIYLKQPGYTQDDFVEKIAKYVRRPIKFKQEMSIGQIFCLIILNFLLSEFIYFRYLYDPIHLTITTFFSFKGDIDIPFVRFILNNIFLVIFVVLCVLLLIILCVLLPKSLAEKHPVKPLKVIFPVYKAFYFIFKPVIFITMGLFSLLERVFKIHTTENLVQITENEIRMLVDAVEDTVIEESQKEMINNILEFDDITAGEVMVHRTNIAAASVDSNISDIIDIITKEGFSRIPLYQEDMDNITGIIYAKDLLSVVGKTADDYPLLSEFIRKPLFIPESMKCVDVFELFSESKVHLAIVVDEYGGTAGMITMENILEAIVGAIQDEYDDEEDDIKKSDDGTYILSGAANLEDCAEELGIKIDEKHEYDTIGGFITDLLGRFPAENEHPIVEYENIKFTVLLTKERRIAKVKAVRVISDQNIENDQ